MQLITNANPGEILMALFGRTATFKTVNLANNSWIELGLKTESSLLGGGTLPVFCSRCRAWVSPLSLSGISPASVL